MPHMMDDYPLLLSTLYARAVSIFPDQTVVSVDPTGRAEQTYEGTDDRVRKLATALKRRLGLHRGDVIGTLAWNTRRHHELYWATANTGLICHTVNIRLSSDQLEYVINHAGDRVVFVDPDLLPLLEPIAGQLAGVEAYVVLDETVPETTLPNAIAYEELIASAAPWAAWPDLDERSPMMLCYSSGTTGNPKGVAYTQRSTYLHTVANLANYAFTANDNILPVVPMFHAAAWGYPFMATTVGARITYPGSDVSPVALVRLFQTEEVTFSAGVPTVWLGVQQYLMDHPEDRIPSIRSLLIGGSAAPPALIHWFWESQGIEMVQGWGMTETNPIAAVGYMTPSLNRLPFAMQLPYRETAGLPVLGLEVKIVDEEGNELPRDGEAFGELLIRGPWIAAEYFNDSRTAESFVDGWLRTGDVCRIEPEGYIRITDRAKDMIKSGGEWISSLDLERILMAHPAVADAAVIGVKHPKWQERPIALVVVRPGEQVAEEDLIGHLEGKVAKWWIPDAIRFVDELPKTGTGKLDKKAVRDRYSELLLDG